MRLAPLARVLRLNPDFQQETVRSMLKRHHTEAPSYWTQLGLAAGIATFGLVLNSGAVIIGAMLVAPLMGPIIELAMGLAVGSALLAIRSAARVGVSVVVAILASGLLTRMLPFQEVTAEIAARTSPTVLDLGVASLCALTAAFVTLKPHDTMSTAAGTSIGISLVPPLCASGFGLGVGQMHVAWGALLLFTANLSAILLFAVIVFLLSGFGEVKAGMLEEEVVGELPKKSPIIRLSARLNGLFGSRNATVFKLLLPITLVGAVFVPLQRALATVSAEVQARQKMAKILGERPELRNALVTAIDFDQSGLAVRLVVLGDPSHAKELEDHLKERIASQIGSPATVSVLGVPDAAAVARMAAAAMPAPVAVAPPPPPKVLPLSELDERVSDALATTYPEKEAGPLLRWSLAGNTDPPVLRLTHHGEPLGAAATKLLGEALSDPLNGPVQVMDDAISPLRHEVADAAALATEISVAREKISGLSDLRFCVEVPGNKRFPALAQKQVEATREALGLPEGAVREGAAYTLQISKEPCPPPPAPPAK
ncbi:MAG: DUF389 domain-containing protein [Polyangiaceae bacterium]